MPSTFAVIPWPLISSMSVTRFLSISFPYAFCKLLLIGCDELLSASAAYSITFLYRAYCRRLLPPRKRPLSWYRSCQIQRIWSVIRSQDSLSPLQEHPRGWLRRFLQKAERNTDNQCARTAYYEEGKCPVYPATPLWCG